MARVQRRSAPGEEDRDEADVAERLDAFGRWATSCSAAPTSSRTCRGSTACSRTRSTSAGWDPVEAPDDDVVRVVHAPNHRHYKGTRTSREARSSGYARRACPVELVLVEG